MPKSPASTLTGSLAGQFGVVEGMQSPDPSGTTRTECERQTLAVAPFGTSHQLGERDVAMPDALQGVTHNMSPRVTLRNQDAEGFTMRIEWT